ncbi:MAG: hypothetical protein PHW07_00360 [Sulfurospirillaceae bacterium]|nr:hypothetical protein [Sulfurospirillaceae bacterium]
MNTRATIQDKILDYIYLTSKKPILLKDMLTANSQFNEGLYVDSAKLGFRMKIARAYLVYTGICCLILIPLFGVTHALLANIDSHVSILGVVMATAGVFIGFNFFKSKMRDAIALKQIKKAWSVHLPYFPYEKYSVHVEKIYNEAVKKEIQKKDLEKYILDNIVKEG